jgi:hypothetical protein
MEYFYVGIVCLMGVEAVLFWKLGYARGMLHAMMEQTEQEKFKMWTEFFKGDDDEDEE